MRDSSSTRFGEFTEPLITTEPVMTEALYLLGRVPEAARRLLSLWEGGWLVLSFAAGGGDAEQQRRAERRDEVFCHMRGANERCRGRYGPGGSAQMRKVPGEWRFSSAQIEPMKPERIN